MHIVSLQQGQKEAVQGHKLSLNLLKCSAIYRKSCRYILEKIIIIKLIVLKKQKTKKRERDAQTLRYTITHSDSSQKPLRHISYNDANEENDGLQPRVSQDE